MHTSRRREKGSEIQSEWIRRLGVLAVVVVTLMLGGCNANVGVGVSVGVPIGDHGYVSLGSNRWF